jgi:hypothetical protein
MKRICLTVIGIYILFLASFAQQFKTDTSGYKNLDLKLEEVNLVSGYYQQDGNHSAVTGGIGTQKLNDISNVLELKFVKWNIFDDKYTFSVEAGLDHHTAASQKYISKTGASKPYGTRFYPSFSWKVENANRTTVGFGASFSSEFNYHSYGINFSLGKVSRDKNREVNFKAQAFFDKVTMIEPSEFTPKPTGGGTAVTYTTASGRVITSYSGSGASSGIPKNPRNTFSGSLSLSQVVNKNFQVAVITDGVAQNGLLSLPFHRVYFNSNGADSVKIENLPSTRFKLPLGLRMNYFAGDKVVFRTYYRYYTDSWGINSHTAMIEIPYKISPFVSFSPFYRYYTQTAANYFAPYKVHATTDQYYTSNYDLSAFSSQFVGFNLRITPKKGVFKIPMFSMIELRYGHYVQTTSLQADNIGINFRFK